ncbi:uncharacterized protein LOC131065369 [Cryptomeria japonica]|uniref:uncharacterized protein LOC131065369 n=1 Tax=Cryptomeria japonica TaxID=3369 RepID=UPI0027DA2602|nr:uncharacterized protein LOC131065369 [Cryptomeria japonica]
MIERDIGAQETCHMLLELPLVESNRKSVNLNVSHEVFKPVTITDEESNKEQANSFIAGYRTRPFCMEGVSLIDAARSWIYNPKRRRDNKWEPRQRAAIVRGISIILVGDLGQLPPVNDRPAYDSNRREKLLWGEFKTVVTLDKIFRQNGENFEQRRFCQLLTNLRDANPQIEDWKLLMTRIPANMDAANNVDFDNTVHLFSTNDNVHNHNKKMLHLLKQPIARSVATKAGSVNIVEDCSSGELELELLISKNSRVMLTSNLWIQVGLVNGALGYIQKIVYKPRSAPLEPPTYVMVEFDNYSGLPFEDHHPSTIPVTPIQKGRTLQLPLRLAWALTIHKSQGLTLPKETIDTGPRERTWLTFVAISCVKSLESLRIMPPFTYDRYEKMKNGRQLAKCKVEE